MRAKPLAALILCTAGLGGCGGDDSSTSAPAARPGAAPAGPLAERCGRAAQDGATAEAVPAGLLPEGSEVVAGGADDATVLIPQKIADAFRSIRQAAPGAGFEVERTEFEGVDGELELRASGGGLEIRLKPARACDGATEAALHRVG